VGFVLVTSCQYLRLYSAAAAVGGDRTTLRRVALPGPLRFASRCGQLHCSSSTSHGRVPGLWQLMAACGGVVRPCLPACLPARHTSSAVVHHCFPGCCC
jgi:hypothetical protein